MEAASSSSAAPPSKLRQFWRARRKRRTERLPQTLAITAGMFVCVVLAVEQNVFSSWRPSPPGHAVADLGWQSSGNAGSETGRQLSTSNLTAAYWNSYECPVEANSSSIFPSLDFEDQRGAAVTFIVIITLYMFLGLAIVCDSFFEASLDAICNAMNLKDDVAGATWMAAGGSAPEFATSVIGVFISRSDVGFGTIVGSAVFNVLFVIGCCAFVAPNLKLTWWPLARDASYYCFSLAMIVIFVSDDFQIAVWEATILLLMYVGYVTVMYFNENLEAWVTNRVKKNAENVSGPQKMLKKAIESPVFAVLLYAAILANAVMVILEIIEFNRRAAELPCVCGINVGAAQLPPTTYYYINLAFNIFFIVEMLVKFFAYGFFGYWKIPLNCFDGSLVFLIVIELILTEGARVPPDGDPLSSANDSIGVGVARLLRLLKFVRFIRTLRVLRIARGIKVGADTAMSSPGADAGDVGAKVRPDGVAEGKEPAKDVEGQTEEEEDDDDDDGPFNPFEIWGDFSSPAGIFGRCMWFIGLPLSIAFWLTIPDCRRPMFAKFWFFTFSNCIIWIALLATIMVWMVERFGVIYEVPTSIMGIFVLAAGTSIPDCLSSVAVARRGHGDMAVSSSIGSNIFDVLIGLPTPWFIYTAILRPAFGEEFGPQWVPVESEALAIYILLLFVMVALVITLVHLSGWVLSTKLGGSMMFLYFCFLIVALMLDDITGPVVFPPCEPISGIGGR